MKIYKLSYLFIAFVFLGCVNEDPYIDWKRMNDEWFQAHKTDAGFTFTESGLCYKIIRHGNTSDRIPNSNSYIVGTYKKKLIDGTVFEQGIEKEMGRLSFLEEGLKDIVVKMHHGDIYDIYIPYQLTFDSKGDIVNYSIPKYSVILYRIELVDSYK